MLKTIQLLTLCLLTLSPTLAQAPALSDEMNKLDFLVGEWKGPGFQLRPDGARESSFKQKTKVQIKDGWLLRVKDERTSKQNS